MNHMHLLTKIMDAIIRMDIFALQSANKEAAVELAIYMSYLISWLPLGIEDISF